ncbi:hypothetical protein EDB81DRAFT_764992 [Dactylonectria macrodidyma]|uniref:CipC-like antibiotic response protein n=1 Tax=Dactylonectria macrodidyma TaxID=307937 RepID=A0A9P9IMG1_9HYPO|nr:hypothetical protein EDB81DRAFT_764992 [Dactylonectria macrodidyma]
MFGFDEAREQRDEVYNNEHQSHWTHELVAGGAAFEAMKKFEDSQRNKGTFHASNSTPTSTDPIPGEAVNHGFAKELLAGLAGAEVDKLVETKGLDFFDREKAKRHAKKQAEDLYDQQYADQDRYDPNQQRRHESMDY